MSSEQQSKENIEPNESNQEPKDCKPTQLPLSLSKIKGITFRKRVDPLVSSSKDFYQIHRKVKHTIKGTRIYFQFKKGNQILYSTKMKGKHPDDPLPIAF